MVYTTASYFAQPIDFRGIQLQNDYLSAVDCYSSQGILNSEVLSGKFEVTDCGFSEKVIKDNAGLIQVRVLDSVTKKEIYSSFVGIPGVLTDCAVADLSKGAQYFPVCFSGVQPVFYFDKGEKKSALLEIDVASNNRGTMANKDINFLTSIGVKTDG